jgi:proteasome lid subunit RPN8/RPN11
MKPYCANAPVSILRDCILTLRRACEGPVEQGGLLLGTRSSRGSLIYDARPLPRALRTPTRFQPSRWRSPPGLRRDAVGWFHSHPGAEAYLSRADARVHRGLFPRGDGLALVVGWKDEAPIPSPPASPLSAFQLALYTGSPPRAVDALRVV